MRSSYCWFCMFFPLMFNFVLSVSGRRSTKGAGLSSLVTLIRINRHFMTLLLWYSCDNGPELLSYDCYFAAVVFLLNVDAH